MTSLLLLLAAASASYSAPWWLLAVLIPGLWRATQGARIPRHDPQAGPSLPQEVQVATIYERRGRLVLRKRAPS